MATPLHARVSEELRSRIFTGALPPGAPLPSEAQLCAEFETSRGTVRAALATLRHAGLIGGGQGKPPVVRDNSLSQPFENLLSFSTWAERAGRAPGQRTIELARRGASPTAAGALGLAPGDLVVEITRVRSLDGEAVMHEASSFLPEVGRILFDFDPDSGSIYGFLREQGVDLSTARHTMDAVAATERDAELLDLEIGAPLLRERRTVWSTDGVALEYAEDRYRPDRVTFTFDNFRPTTVGLTHDLRILKETS